MDIFQVDVLSKLERIAKSLEILSEGIVNMVEDPSRNKFKEREEDLDFIERQEQSIRLERLEVEKLRLEKERKLLEES